MWRISLLLLPLFILVAHGVVFNEKLRKPFKPAAIAENVVKKNKKEIAQHGENNKRDVIQHVKKQFIPGQQFWTLGSRISFQQQQPPFYGNQPQTVESLVNMQPSILPNVQPQPLVPNAPLQAMYPQVQPADILPSPNVASSFAPVEEKSKELTDLTESQENFNAAYKGLSYYTGSLVEPGLKPYPAGFPVSLDVDKEPPTTPPTTTSTTTTTTTTTVDPKTLMRDQVITSYAKLEYGEGAGKTGFKMDAMKLGCPGLGCGGGVEKMECTGLGCGGGAEKKLVPDARQFFQKPPPDIPMNKLALLFNPAKTTINPDTVATTTTTTTNQPTTATTTSTTTTTKAPCPLCETEEKVEKKEETPDGMICYLPRIVVNTRLMGTTVINEIKIYTSPRDENSVHRFITSHEVSDAASKISHEFILPPQFITQKSLSAADLKFMNNTPIMMTSAFTETNHHQPPVIPIQLLTQYPMSLQYPPNTHQDGVGPTFNPYLPTSKQTTTNPKPVTTESTTPGTSTTTTTTSTIPTTITSTSTTTSTIPTTTPTTSSTTTPTTSTSTSTTTSTTTLLPTTTTAAPLIMTTPSDVKAKKRHILETLNYKARHRNALLDLPAGDSSAYSGYQMFGPPDIQWVKKKHKRKR